MGTQSRSLIAAAAVSGGLVAVLAGIGACTVATSHPPMPAPAPQPEPSSAGAVYQPPDQELWVIAKPSEEMTVVMDSIATDQVFTATMQQGRSANEAEALSHADATARATTAELAVSDLDLLGAGAMVASIPPGAEFRRPRSIPLPLKHTDVEAVIRGYIGTVGVKQRFENPFDTKIEAVYLFPLPEKAAVSEFLMVIGERTIRGIVREKEEAEQIYRQARAQGYRASLLVQRRPNVFEQKVANIEPGKSIDVDITYFHTLAYKDGWYSFVFPSVVGPRYNPPDHADPLGAVSRGSNGADPAAVEYLTPNERSGHDISIRLDIDAGVAIEELKSTHEVAVTRPTRTTAEVALKNETTVPNRDFVLDFRVAGETMKSNLLAYKDPETGDGYFTLMLIPPRQATAVARQPLELVFVIDASGSMRGRPLQQAKEAVATALDRLGEDDTFQIIRFSENASQFGPVPVPATPRNLGAARGYLSSLQSGGGTEVIQGIKAALDFPHDSSRLRFVSFLTDGYIGNEAEILAAIRLRIGASRIFSFGVGSSVNRYLLERMATVGRGVVAYLGLNDSARTVMDGFLDRISRPVLADIEIDWGAMTVASMYPSAIPDLFVGRPLVLTGAFTGATTSISISGLAAGERQTLAVALDKNTTAGSSLAKVWARTRIAELADRQAWSGDPGGELREAIANTALHHQLVSNYTSFVAVDSLMRTAGDHGVTVHQAVPVPDGVRYDTTVQ